MGEWTIEVLRPETSSDSIHGRHRFEWMMGGRFLVQHWTTSHPDFPDGMAVLAPDTADSFTWH